MNAVTEPGASAWMAFETSLSGRSGNSSNTIGGATNTTGTSAAAIRRSLAASPPSSQPAVALARNNRNNISVKDVNAGLGTEAKLSGRTSGSCARQLVVENTRLNTTLVTYPDNTSDNIHPVQGVQSVLHRRQKRRCSTKHHSPVKRPPT